MSFRILYQEVQKTPGKISTSWIEEEATRLSRIKKVTEQWSDVVDPKLLRGFYIEGPMGPPVRLGENEALIVLSRAMCLGLQGKYWRRYIKTKELMHVFDVDGELTDTAEKFDQQVERFADPTADNSSQYRADINAMWRAMALLCREADRLKFKGQLDANEISVEVVSVGLQLPTSIVRNLMRDNFLQIIESVMGD